VIVAENEHEASVIAERKLRLTPIPYKFFTELPEKGLIFKTGRI
jgi:hypothetical protein